MAKTPEQELNELKQILIGTSTKLSDKLLNELKSIIDNVADKNSKQQEMLVKLDMLTGDPKAIKQSGVGAEQVKAINDALKEAVKVNQEQKQLLTKAQTVVKSNKVDQADVNTSPKLGRK